MSLPLLPLQAPIGVFKDPHNQDADNRYQHRSEEKHGLQSDPEGQHTPALAFIQTELGAENAGRRSKRREVCQERSKVHTLKLRDDFAEEQRSQSCARRFGPAPMHAFLKVVHLLNLFSDVNHRGVC